MTNKEYRQARQAAETANELYTFEHYSIELTRENWQVLQAFLIGYGLKYESCGCYNLVLVTIWCNPMQAENINRFLEANT